MNRIDGQVFKAFHQPAGPAYLHRINLGRRSEAKVNAHTIIGDVARAAAHFVDKRAHAGSHGDLCPNAVAIRFRPSVPGKSPGGKERPNELKPNQTLPVATALARRHGRAIWL